jgi:hypothetical protein
MYLTSCTDYYPEPTNAQYIYIYINNILCTVSPPTCFNASGSCSGSLNFVLCQSYRIIKIIKVTTQYKYEIKMFT